MTTIAALILTILIIFVVQEVPSPKFYIKFMEWLGAEIAKNIKRTKYFKRVFWIIVALIIPAYCGIVYFLTFKSVLKIITRH